MNVWLITDNDWRDLENHGQYISGMELLTRLRAKMTEVNLDEVMGEWLDGVVADGGKPFSSHVLARIKEGK